MKVDFWGICREPTKWNCVSGLALYCIRSNLYEENIAKPPSGTGFQMTIFVCDFTLCFQRKSEEIVCINPLIHFVTTFITHLLHGFGLAPELVPQGETAIWSTLAGRAEISACTLAPSCESFLERNQKLPRFRVLRTTR